MPPWDSESPSPSTALERLRTWRLPTPASALDALSALRSQTQLLALYQQYFPSQYLLSSAPCVRERGSFSPREREFLILVNHELFPLEVEWMDEWAEEGETGIYLSIINPSCFEVDLAELSLPLQVLVALLAISEIETWQALCRQIGRRAPLPVTVGGVQQIDWKRLSKLCRRRGGFWRDVPLAFDVVAHSTGNFWLDIDEDNVGYERIEWDVDAVEYLAAEWRKAKPLLARYERVLAWLNHKPGALAALVRLWNRAAVAPV